MGLIGFLYVILTKKAKLSLAWKRLRIVYIFGSTLFFCSFILIEYLVATAWNRQPNTATKVDYILILGAGLKKDTVSNRLRVRLNKGLEYATQYPKAQLILSGGQGSDELISEAEAMRRYVISQNLNPRRILLEDQSTSTVENLLFSQKLLSDEQASVLIVTSDYHLYRALMLARRQGYNCEGASATSPLDIRLNYTLREYMVMMKDLIFR